MTFHKILNVKKIKNDRVKKKNIKIREKKKEIKKKGGFFVLESSI